MGADMRRYIVQKGGLQPRSLMADGITLAEGGAVAFWRENRVMGVINQTRYDTIFEIGEREWEERKEGGAKWCKSLGDGEIGAKEE